MTQSAPVTPPPDRAVVYIDGNNWYHAMMDAGVKNPLDLSYAAISKKLLGPREWVETRYYIGALKHTHNPTDYAAQRTFLSRIANEDKRITVHLGRIEMRKVENTAIPKLRQYANNPQVDLSDEARKGLNRILDYYSTIEVPKEKAVDVMIARDIIVGAKDGEYETAYLLSADGDFTPVIESATAWGKKVFCASPGYSSQLAKVARKFLRLEATWFNDCYRA